MAKIDEGAPVVGDGERLVTLSLTTPSASPTRALSSTQEDAVHTVDVLLFKGEDFFYRAIGGQPNASNEFTVKLPSNAAAYKAVVLANARSMLSAIPVAQEQTPGTTRTNLLASITQQLTLPVTGWTNSLATNGIPMWGYENDLVVNEGSSNPAATIALTRMVAKIDITVDNLVTNFKLANARLYNYSQKGSIAPAVSTSSSTGYEATQWNGAKAIAPHLPAGAKVAGGYIDYSISSAPGSLGFTNEIYTYEAQAGTANTVTNTCLVIGGYYEGSASPTYYRVEFVGTDGTTFFHLLRNHKYSVTIKEVNDHGYPSANDAYINKPVNIVVQIVPWNDGGLNYITFDGQHYLAVDKSEIIFYAAGGSKSMEAITDFPAGWTIEKDAVHDWFTVSPLTHASTSQQTITVTIPTGNGPREGFFYIVAGNLRKKIIVKQLAEDEFAIQITDPVTGKPLDELTFGPGNPVTSTYPAARSFNVSWLPANAPCTAEVTSVGVMNPFVFHAGNPTLTSPFATSPRTFSVQPESILPNQPDRISRLDFSVSHGGQYRTAVVYLRQINDYVTATPNAAGYLADGATLHSFPVRANCPWVAEISSNPNNLIIPSSITTSGGPNTSGQPFAFKLNASTTGATATVSFKSPDGTLTYATATIQGNAIHVTLAETTYNTTTSDAHTKTVSMTTNIPTNQLTTTITGPGSLVTGASITTAPALMVNLAKHTLTTTYTTYTVEVKFNGQVMATLTVNVINPDWEIIGGKLVGPNKSVSFITIQSSNVMCPAGSSQPRTPEEAMWYEANLGSMVSESADQRAVIDEDGPHIGEAAVIWLYAPRVTIS
ncbi:MAG: hypothetical protein LBI96_00040, partial [Odoribacteraceae bacterium]|nr:hypothetical protein [Odoribacteraceae bacterium]